MKRARAAKVITAGDFLVALFHYSEHNIYFSSLPNERNDPKQPGERRIVTREVDALSSFIAKWDRPGRGLFFCVSTIDGPRRAKVHAIEILGLHTDQDFKAIEGGETAARLALTGVRCAPTAVVHSGNGLHAYWLFKEPLLLTDDNRDRVEAALRLLADHVAGDLAVCEVARLMRLPGTHNTKGGSWCEVTVERIDGPRYELDDLEEWLAESAPVARRASVSRPSGAQPAAANAEPDNPFLAAALALGFKPPVDVEARLRIMRYGGPGDSSIHSTQLSVSASLLNAGRPIDDVVELLLQATRAAAGELGTRWHWGREEKALRRMCETWLKKHPPQPVQLPLENTVNVTADDGNINSDATQGEGDEMPAFNPPPDNVTDLGQARAKRKAKPKPKSDNVPAAFWAADAVIEVLRKSGEDVMLTEGELWLYGEGVWRIADRADDQRLTVMIQSAFEELALPARGQALSLALKRIREHPEVYKRAVAWAGPGVVVCQNGVLRLNPTANGDLVRGYELHSPLNYARRKIGAEYDPTAACPQFLELLGSMFTGRDDAVELIALVQEWAGAALAVESLSREERKALLSIGPSRTGKTEISRMFRHLLGEPIAAPSIADISSHDNKFGLETLYGASAWIRDDAINEGDRLDPQRFKTIVTGEPIDIQRKGRGNVRGHRFAIPVMLTINTLPKARDVSDAIFNRSLVLDMTNVVTEAEAVEIRQAKGVPLGETIGSHIVKAEAPGILNWALAGLQRLMKRGHYDPPLSVRMATQRFKDDNNPVSEWIREAVERDRFNKISRADLLCAYHGWQREQDGDEAKAIGAKSFWPLMRTLTPWIAEARDSSGMRAFSGIRLTEVGLRFWELHKQGPQLKGGSTGNSMGRTDVNKVCTPGEVGAEPPNKHQARF